MEWSCTVAPKFISPSDPAAQWTGAHKGHAFFACADNYLIDLKAAIIIDVEATRANRRAEVDAVRTMLDRTTGCFGLKPERLSADSAYGSAEILDWLLEKKKIAPHVPVWDKSERTDGTFSRSDFVFDAVSNTYTCPGGKNLQQYHRAFTRPRTGVTCPAWCHGLRRLRYDDRWQRQWSTCVGTSLILSAIGSKRNCSDASCCTDQLG